MKTLNNLRYILFAFLILGLLANYAQDSYWVFITVLATELLAIVSLIAAFIYLKKMWNHKKTSLTFFMLFILSIVLFIVFRGTDTTLGGSMLWVMLGLLMIELICIVIENWKRPEPSNRFLALENGGIFFLLAGYAFKLQHYPGASFMLIASMFLFLFLYLFKAFKQLFSEWKNGKNIAILSFLFYIYLILFTIAWVFKIQHFPGSKIIINYPPVILVFLLIPLLLNIKFQYGADKISFGKYLKKASPIFFFIYITFIGLFNYMQVLNIGPKMISIYPAVYQKMVDGTYKSGKMEPRIVTYYSEDENGKGKIKQFNAVNYYELQSAYFENYQTFSDNFWKRSIKQ